MTLRDYISIAAALCRLAGAVVLIPGGVLMRQPWLGVAAGVAWMLACGPLLRFVILPAMFPQTICPGCKRTIPLVGRWKCGGHYTDHRERHILTFYCSHGHVLESFDCPRCQSTILVQFGDQKVVRHGTALRLATANQLPDHDGLLLGHDRNDREINLPPETLAWHMAITGGTGRGKSTLLGHMARQLAQQGAGFTLLDPGGDLSRSVLQHIPPERVRDVTYVNVSDRDHPFPINILATGGDVERASLTEELLGVFHRMHGAAWGPMLAHQLRMALRTAMLAGGSLKDVYAMFNDAATRARMLRPIKDSALRSFWTEEFPSIPAMRRSAVLNKLAPIVFHPLLEPIICARTCGVNADRIIAERRILIVNLASGSPADDVTSLLGTFLVQKIMAAAFRQSAIPESSRVPHVLLVDEFQRFMHRAAAFDQILAETRKFKLALVVANQYVEQLAVTVRAAMFGNVGCLLSFRVGHRDARLLTAEFDGSIPEDLMELELGRCLVRIGGDWTTIGTVPPIATPTNNPSAQIIAGTRGTVDSPSKQTDAPVIDPVPDNESEFVN